MADQWFYRMFGEEFGPASLEELKALVDSGSLSAEDEVRASDSGQWVVAASVEQLGLNGSGSQVPVDAGNGSASSIDVQSTKSADEWFCMIGGAELGPLSFEELTEYAENEQLSADDQVKLGANGKWRRVGSIGRLMAVIPYKAVEKSIVPSPPKPKTPAIEMPVIDEFVQATAKPDHQMEEFEDLSDLVMDTPEMPVPSRAPAAPVVPNVQATFQAAYEEAKAKIAESMMAQAEAGFKAAEEQAKAQIAWATGPKVDRQWWGWASGVEFGPVEFAQVFGLAKSGQLKPTDLVRNGQFGHFGPSSNVPGLFNAVAMIARATETLNLARTQAKAAVELAVPPPAMPESVPNGPPAATSISNPFPATTASTARNESLSNSAQMPVVKSDPMVNTAARRERMGPNLEAIARMEIPAQEEPVVDSRPSPPMSRPEPRSEPRPAAYSSPANSSSSPMSTSNPYSSSMATASSSAAMRPVIAPKKPAARSSSGSSWFSDLFEQLKEPKAIGALCVVALIGLIFGWQYLPKSRGQDIKYYRELKQILDDLRSKRNSPSDLTSLIAKAKTTTKRIADDLKNKANRDEPAKQALLWAARDEFPRAAQAGFATESNAEKAFAARLQEAAYQLGLEARPKVVIQNAPLPND